MAIQYKKIIKQIIGPEATDHGFEIGRNAPNGYWKKTLANYEKNVDELYRQGFDIEYDHSHGDELILSSLGISEKRTFDKCNEESFREAIAEFAEIMHKKGYKIFEEDEKKPRFSADDHGFLLKNHKELATQFIDNNHIDNNIAFLSKIDIVVKKVAELKEVPFEEAKESLIYISAFYIKALLECDGTVVDEYRGYNCFVIVSGKMGATNVLRDIMHLWMEGDNDNFIRYSCMVAMPQLVM